MDTKGEMGEGDELGGWDWHMHTTTCGSGGFIGKLSTRSHFSVKVLYVFFNNDYS